LATILSIVPYHILPPGDGGQNAIVGFNNFLGRRHKVLIASTPLNAKGGNYSFTTHPLFSKSRFRYLNFFKAFTIANFCKEHTVDYLIAEQPFIALIVYLVSKIRGIPFYIRSHNIEFQRARSIGKWWWRLLKPYERWAMKKADAIFFITSYDRDVAIRTFNISINRCHILPYGIDHSSIPDGNDREREAIIRRHKLNPEERILLFFGAFDYQPNALALEIILGTINPQLLKHPQFKYKIIICGRRMPSRYNNLIDFSDRNILYLGFVEKIDEYIKGADVILNPIITGGGIKTKVVESISFDKNVVSTKTGAIGVDTELCNGKLLISEDDDWNAFTQNILKAASLQLHTPKSFFDEFYWGNITDKVNKFLIINKGTK
jgi:glycosyltransferase involved in cell wall biosynthesis